MIKFRIPSVPVPQPRPRATVRAGHAAVYSQEVIKNARTGEKKPHPIVMFKASVKTAFANAYPNMAPLDGPLIFHALFLFPRPKAKIWAKRPMPREPLVSGSRNDGDNLTKSVWDALNELAFRDDGQIYKWSGEKWIAAGDERPHVEVTITTYAELMLERRRLASEQYLEVQPEFVSIVTPA
jgi:Holliday junction resolvase RusA-like endonuclease